MFDKLHQNLKSCYKTKVDGVSGWLYGSKEMIGFQAGIFIAKSGDITIAYFEDGELIPACGYYIRFYANENFVSVLQKMQVRGFQRVEIGENLKKDGPRFTGIFKGTKLLFPL